MAADRVFHGARAKVFVTKPGEPAQLIGLFDSVDGQVGIAVEPVPILGRFSAAALENTAYEPVGLSMHGWRVAGQGAHKAGAVPKLQDLMTAEPITVDIFDRLTGEILHHVENVRPTGYSFNARARQLADMPINYIGLIHSDEDGPQAEGADASFLPST